ncbi:pentapeptide repeat-containing protein [Burkholderia alba]|uniref:pentapeptide repeat-containing protein n=1 Tax=Burkholderia alba TaxID=2683677 RepID=UPI002B05A41F|nr:pentapeptide repeat-containing protein [Burkholderia alba]
MKIIKPDTLALLPRTFRFDGVDRLSIGALACFPLRDTPVGPADLATEADLWRIARQALGDDAPLDEGFPKPSGEFLVYGQAHAPARATRTPVAVRARIGAACKARLIDTPTHAALAEFHARPPSDPERTRHLGAFDARWQAEHWPHLPAGTRADYFHTAPRDQRIAAFWREGEIIELVNLHAEQSIMTGALPRIRARCFVERSVDGAPRVDVCPLRAETVWLLPGEGCGIVLYRGTVLIDDEDGDDVVRLIAAWEHADAPPLPDDAYLNRPTTEHPDPRVESVHAAAPASAALFAAETEAGVEAGDDHGIDPQAPAPDLSSLVQAAAALDAQTDALLAERGLTDADIERLLPARDAPANLNLDELAALAAELDAQAEQWHAQYGAFPGAADPHAAASPLASDASDPAFGALLRQADAEARALVAQHAAPRAAWRTMAQDRPEFAALAASFDALDPNEAPLDVEALTASLAALAEPAPADTTESPDPRPRVDPAAAGGAPPPPAAPPSDDASTARPPTREWVIERHARGLGFAGLDLSGLDLSSACLEHADFRDARLDRTRFTGSRLAGASFERAILPHADFASADLRAASFVDASAPRASCRAAVLDCATLDRADFSGGDFTQASLTDGRCTHTQFDGSTMTGLAAARLEGTSARFADCVLDAADFTSAHLPKASFQAAKLAGTTFASAQCDGVEWFGAHAPNARFRSASLRHSRADASTCFAQADLSLATLDDANWDGVDLYHANLHKATLDRASLVRAAASGVQLTLTSARHADLSKSDLNHADLRFSNLFGASLRRARLAGAQLQSSNLYGVDCYGTALETSQLDGADIARTVLVVEGRPELTPSR